MMKENKGCVHNERGWLFSILCTLLLFVVCCSLIAESCSYTELFDEQRCLCKDTKVKKLESKAERAYVDLRSLCRVKDKSRSVGLICLYGLATFDRHANIGCFNKFIMRKLAV